MGLVARFLEADGIVTVILTPVPEFARKVGMPRVAGIEYPFGRPVGEVHDIKGQREVLMSALQVFEETRKPGTVVHLPFTWHEDPRKTNWHPPEISPIIKLFLGDVKKAGSDARKKE
ncbi:MAG: hypothetical protein NT072_00460 [Deltaproteobacteria bacterium]|nr:hypothetical protein [Deltaproteobacteria bacterium]